MNKTIFIKCGRAMYGKLWKTAMAEETGWDRMTIAHYASGKWPIPGPRQQEIFNLIRAHLDHVRKLFKETKDSLK